MLDFITSISILGILFSRSNYLDSSNPDLVSNMALNMYIV